MQARYVILRVLLEAGEGLVQLTSVTGSDGKPDVLIKLDKTKIESVGRPAIGKFLKKLQVSRSLSTYTSYHICFLLLRFLSSVCSRCFLQATENEVFFISVPMHRSVRVDLNSVRKLLSPIYPATPLRQLVSPTHSLHNLLTLSMESSLVYRLLRRWMRGILLIINQLIYFTIHGVCRRFSSRRRITFLEKLCTIATQQ